MHHSDKTNEQLIAELAQMQRRVAELEAFDENRERAEQALKESEERYRSFVQSFPGIAYRGRIDFSVVFFHGAVEEITGYSERDFTSGEITWDQVMHRGDFASLHDSIEKVRLVPNYSTEREYRVQRKDGKIRWIHDVIHNICDSSGKPACVQGVVYDVTDRKEAEEALRKSEQWARCILETVPLGITECTLDGVITRNNPAYEEMWGYSSDELVGKAIVDLLEDGPDKQALPAYLKQLASEQPPPKPYYCRGVTKDGRHIDVQVDWTYIRDSEDEVTGFVSALSDITEKKRAETLLKQSRNELEQRVQERTRELVTANDLLQAEVAERKQIESELRQTNQELQAMYDGMADGVLIADTETRQFLRANPAICKMLGYTEEELLRMSPAEIHPQEDLPQILEYFDAMVQGRLEKATDIPCLCRDESLCYANISVVHLSYGGRPCLVGFFHDITDRKEANAALRSSEEKYRLIAENVTDVVWTGRFSGLHQTEGGLSSEDNVFEADELLDRWEFTFVSPSIQPVLGFTVEEALRLKLRDVLTPTSYADLRNSILRLVAGLQTSPERRQTLELEHITRNGDHRWCELTVKSLQGQPDGMIGVEGVTRDVSDRKRFEKDLSEISGREQQRLGQQLHDDVGQLVFGARLEAASLKESLHATDSPEEASAAILVGILTEVQDAVHDLISGFRPVEVDAGGLMAAISELATSTQRGSNVHCFFRCSEPVPLEDNLTATQLYYIAREAVLNAVKHANASRITIGLEKNAGQLTLWVRDDGTGINTDAAEATDRMGLRIMRHRAGLLGALLSIESVEDSGTQVTCTLMS